MGILNRLGKEAKSALKNKAKKEAKEIALIPLKRAKREIEKQIKNVEEKFK